jgi:hypothetical protein
VPNTIFSAVSVAASPNFPADEFGNVFSTIFTYVPGASTAIIPNSVPHFAFGFVRSASGFYTKNIKFKGPNFATLAIGINNNSELVGGFVNGCACPPIGLIVDGFLRSSPFGIPGFTDIKPIGSSFSLATGINDNDVIVGIDVTLSGPTLVNGYLRSKTGFYSSIDFPAFDTNTLVIGINNKSQFVGAYFDPSDSSFHAFLAH